MARGCVEFRGTFTPELLTGSVLDGSPSPRAAGARHYRASASPTDLSLRIVPSPRKQCDIRRKGAQGQ